MCSLRSFVAKILLELHDFSVLHCRTTRPYAIFALFRGYLIVFHLAASSVRTAHVLAAFLPPAALCPSFFHHSRADFVTVPKIAKTYGRLFGMIFFGGLGSMLAVEAQWLAADRIQKEWKNAKKSVKYSPPDPAFSAKEPPFRDA